MKTYIHFKLYYSDPPSPNSEHRLSYRYNGGIHYTTKSHPVESSLNNLTNFTSPTIDNLSVHNRPEHFISSTNVNVNQQQNDYRNPLNFSTPYLSQIRDDNNDSPTMKSSYQQQQTDRHSNVGSDSGIVMMNPINPQHQISDDNQLIEKKLTNLVQQLGRQLETDAQKLSEKLELKLKNLEHMINQQTYIIRRQDEVIERLKNKILKIESERDHFRERLSIHEQREQDEKKYLIKTETDGSTCINNNNISFNIVFFFLDRKTYEHDDQQQISDNISTNRKFSNTSSLNTEPSRPSTKKVHRKQIVDIINI
jgi:hypothetical protein